MGDDWTTSLDACFTGAKQILGSTGIGRLRTTYLHDIARTGRHYKLLGDGALAQIEDADLHTLVDPDANSIVIW